MSMIDFPLKNSIGVFDSGVGGLSVFREIRKKIPDYPIIYLGDQIHVPYGTKTLEEVYIFSKTITEFLIELGARIIVVACNTASAAALYALRNEYPTIPFVGMEPAVKPAAEKTITGNVGVLATPATFEGKLYNSVVERFGKSVNIFQNTCVGLVQEIEKGNFSGPETRKILENALIPMIENNVDNIVLGCTHYPFVIPMIKQIIGPSITVIDPAPAVAEQTLRKFNEQQNLIPPVSESLSFLFTSGSLKRFSNFVNQLGLERFSAHQVEWSEDFSKINVVQNKIDQN